VDYESQKDVIVKNLVRGINSDNTGVKISAAQRIFEFIEHKYFTKNDFSPAVIPLMKMLREEDSELGRIAAALSLYRIEDSRGIYHLKGAAKFDKSEKVRKVSRNLYYHYHYANGTAYLIPD
jgi:hypothetical protein